MKDHAATIAMVLALAMTLITIMVLVFSGKAATDGPLLIQLAGICTGLAGAIAGKQLSGNSGGGNGTTPTPPPSQS